MEFKIYEPEPEPEPESTGQKSFAYGGARVWSDLDSVVKVSASFSSFRRNYKTKL